MEEQIGGETVSTAWFHALITNTVRGFQLQSHFLSARTWEWSVSVAAAPGEKPNLEHMQNI